MSGEKGFIGSLFDLSFTEFVTTKIIKFLFVLAIIGSAIAAFTLVVTGFCSGFAFGFFSLVISPVVFFLYVLGSRIWLELIIVAFRIAENTDKLVEQDRSQ